MKVRARQGAKSVGEQWLVTDRNTKPKGKSKVTFRRSKIDKKRQGQKVLESYSWDGIENLTRCNWKWANIQKTLRN